jgi:predicted RecB family endonuclease
VTSNEAQHATERKEAAGEPDDGSSALGTLAEIGKIAGEVLAPGLTNTVLDAMLSDSVRDRVLQEAAAGLRNLIDSTVDAIPDSASSGRYHREVDRAERQLHAMLQESINSVFSGPARVEIQRHVEEAARRIAEGNVDTAKYEISQALQSLLSEILTVLQRHWAQTLHLLLGITVKALEATFISHLKGAFSSITAHPAQEVEDKIEPFQEKTAARAEDLRRRLIETRDTMQERLAEAKKQVQGRLGEGTSGAAKGSQRRSRFGAPPARRPPPGPSRNRPPGRAPSGRPPSISR